MAWILLAQVAVIGVTTGFYLVELATGASDSVVRVLGSCLMFVVMGTALAFMARGFLAGRSWPSTPTVVWHALLVPVGVSLIQASRVALGALVLGMAVLVIGAIVVSREPGQDR